MNPKEALVFILNMLEHLKHKHFNDYEKLPKIIEVQNIINDILNRKIDFNRLGKEGLKGLFEKIADFKKSFAKSAEEIYYIDYFLELIKYAIDTGDTTPLLKFLGLA